MNLTLTPTEPPKQRRDSIEIRYTPHHAGGGE